MDILNLTYKAALNKTFFGKFQTRKLLSNITFSVKCGELCALMGPSGAGKR